MSKDVQCLLCPHACVMEPGQRGSCRVRMNLDGELVSLVYGRPVAVHVDPIEKKPLYHFRPGSLSYSLATAGCNLACRFCQNWEISQSAPEEVPPYDLPPEAVVEEAENAGCSSIAYTYTEPIVFYEYMLDTAKLAHERGLRNVMITAGYINQGPLRELCEHMDGANVDLKSIRDDYYRQVCYGKLDPVLDALEVMVEHGVWVEVTNLVVPTLNDAEEDLRDLSRWILDNLGEDVPLHFSRFFPTYRLTNKPPTPVSTLRAARETALEEGLNHVYVGNVVTASGSHTTCPGCGETMIEREGYTVVNNRIEDGMCPECGTEIKGVWLDEQAQ
ncbi:AmmeMemoRadiSam system radical SAM enzyme [Candidatus Fermentibacteria bacterium]|nr:AmmeMemoRadiSam system radical SAM enzyme [Candidatus Fermentibacteria bacterium]